MLIINIMRILCAIFLMLFTFNNFTRGGRRGHGHHGGRHHAAHHGGHGRHGGRGGHGWRGGRGRYGAGYGYGNGYGGWGAWGWANPWVGYPWWDANWQPGTIGTTQYEYVIPEEARQTVYDDNDYRYWGYGLGVDNELDQLAQQGRWGNVRQRLFELHDRYQQELDHELEKEREDQNPERIKELKDRLHKVQLHMRGLR